MCRFEKECPESWCKANDYGGCVTKCDIWKNNIYREEKRNLNKNYEIKMKCRREK